MIENHVEILPNTVLGKYLYISLCLEINPMSKIGFAMKQLFFMDNNMLFV